MRFILAVVQGQLVLSNRRRPDIEAQLEAENYDRLPSNAKKAAAAAAADEDDSEEGDAVSQGSYDYLLSMPLASLTHEKVEALQEGACQAIVYLFVCWEGGQHLRCWPSYGMPRAPGGLVYNTVFIKPPMPSTPPGSILTRRDGAAQGRCGGAARQDQPADVGRGPGRL